VQALPFYVALASLLFVALSVRTLILRRRLGIGLGDAGNEQMLRAIRAHSNFAEYVPLSLLVLCFVELRGAPPLVVHVLALCLLAGRLSHAVGVSRVDENYRFRVVGMAMTFTTLLSGAAYLLLSLLGDVSA